MSRQARKVKLRSGGTVTFETDLNPLAKGAAADLAFIAEVTRMLDEYESPEKKKPEPEPKT